MVPTDLRRLKRVNLEDTEVFGHMLCTIIDSHGKRLVAWILVVKRRLIESTAGEWH